MCQATKVSKWAIFKRAIFWKIHNFWGFCGKVSWYYEGWLFWKEFLQKEPLYRMCCVLFSFCIFVKMYPNNIWSDYIFFCQIIIVFTIEICTRCLIHIVVQKTSNLYVLYIYKFIAQVTNKIDTIYPFKFWQYELGTSLDSLHFA